MSTKHSSPGYSDQQFEAWLATVLRAGVLASAAIVLVGGVLYLVHHGGEPPRYDRFVDEAASFRSVRGIVSQAFAGESEGLVQFGLLVLIATPIARVVFSIVGFARQRDWLYTAVAACVLGLLVYGLSHG